MSFKTKCATVLLLGLCLHAQGAEEQNYFSHVTSSAFDTGDASGLPNFKGTLVKNAGDSPVKDPYVMEVQAEKYSGFLRQRNLEIPNGLVNVSCRYKGKPGGSFEIKFVKNEKSALFKIESEGWQEGSKQLLFEPTVQNEAQLDLIFVPPKGGGTLQVGDIRIEPVPVQLNTIQGAGYQGVGPYRLKERSTEIYALESEFQSKPQFVEVLLPDDFDKSKKYRVLYLLPVEAGQGVQFGDGIMVARKLGIQNQHDLIVVAPAFDSEPWYGNDATDPHRRQEDFLLKAVVPFIESQYPTTRRSFPDEICRNSYFIDIHWAKEEVAKDSEQHKQWEKSCVHYGAGESHGIPYRCLTPAGLKNVLVAGRSVSCEQVVQGSIRVMPVCLAMGEAAGLAAALAARSAEKDVHAVDTDHLRQRLREEHAFLP